MSSDFLFDILESISKEIRENTKNTPSQRQSQPLGTQRQSQPLGTQRRSQPLGTQRQPVLKPQKPVGGAVKKFKNSNLKSVQPDVVEENETNPKELDKTLMEQNNDIFPDFSNLSQKDILKGIVFSEILGKPRALRKKIR